MLNRDVNPREVGSWVRRVATIEGWLALMIAVVSWAYALRPVGPMVGMPVEEFVRDMSPLPGIVIGIGLALGGIRLGSPGARLAGWWAIALLGPLLVLITLSRV